jgi:hypothetical protein
MAFVHTGPIDLKRLEFLLHRRNRGAAPHADRPPANSGELMIIRFAVRQFCFQQLDQLL